MNRIDFFISKKVIGAVHFMPSPGFEGHQGFEKTLQKAKEDTEAFIDGGVDAVIFENNYDYPHSIFVSDEVKSRMIELIKKIAPKIPFGVSVLWNDYRAALNIAKKTGGKFIRVPVFVDRVKTQYGIVEPAAADVIAYRKKIGAEDVLVFTDIHVKHAELLNTMTLQESAKKAVEAGSDAIVITGKWTGDAPILDELRLAREAIGDFPILIGSGVSFENIIKFFTITDGAIVSTSLKNGQIDKKNVNIKSYNQRISRKKVKKLMSTISNI